MSGEKPSLSARPTTRFSVGLELAVLGVLSAVLTFVAANVRPVWDDGWLELLQSDGGGISENMRDRPVLGFIWASLEKHGLLWSSSYVIHWAGWFSMGLVTTLLWRGLFPALDRFALAVGCLAMSPVLCETQFILIATMLGYVPGIVLVYVAFLLFFSPASVGGVRAWRWRFGTLAVALIVPACLVSEYPIPAAIGCGVLGWVCCRKMDLTRRSKIIAVGSFLATACIGYALFRSLTDASARSDVRPEAVISGSQLAKVAAVSFPSTMWRLSLGKFLDKIGSVTVDPSWKGVAVVGVGVLSAFVVTLASRRRREESADAEEVGHAWWRDAWPLALALGVGVAPVVLMRPSVAVEVGTRFWLPVLPLASCLTTFVLLKLLRPRLAWVIIPILGFVVGHSTATEARHELGSLRQTRAWGTEVKKHLSEKGITVAVFQFAEGGSARLTSDYELTARLTRGWPRDDRGRFWAYSSLAQIRDSCDIPWPDSVKVSEIRREVRGVKRAGTIAKFIWVNKGRNDSLEIHPVSTGM